MDTHARKAHTSIIHGKWAHEETIATASFATVFLIVKNLKEARSSCSSDAAAQHASASRAQRVHSVHAYRPHALARALTRLHGCRAAAPQATYVCEYIAKGGDAADFYSRFDTQAMSAGFHPDRDLVRVGIANQTTMLKGETEAIGKMFQAAMMQKYGVEALNEHFMLLDTICDATQERQDAMYELVAVKPDLMLVVGGFNSSNTSHLQEISEDASVPSFWIDTVERLGPGNMIAHRLAHGELVETKDWLPAGKVTIGVTSGASTPDKVVEEILEAVFAIKEGRALPALAAAK